MDNFNQFTKGFSFAALALGIGFLVGVALNLAQRAADGCEPVRVIDGKFTVVSDGLCSEPVEAENN